MDCIIQFTVMLCEEIILPTADQGIMCVTLCQSVTNTFIPIFVVRLDERTGNVFILAGDNIEIEIYRNGHWRFL
jgi:hypothetical protein